MKIIKNITSSNGMKKLIVFGLLMGLIAVNLIQVNVVEAASEPWCYFIFQKCNDNDDSSAPSSAPATNNPPVWTSGQTSYSAKTGELLQFTVNAMDPEGATLIYRASFIPNSANFNENTHVFSWTPSDNQLGNYSIEFSAYDGTNRIYQNINVQVIKGVQNPGNSRPVWTTIPSQTAYVGQTLQFSVYANDNDGDTVNYSALNLPSGSNFQESNRTFTWNPSSGQVGSHIVSFRASDGTNYADMGVTITVINGTPVVGNNKPVLTGFNPPIRANVGKLYIYDVNSTDPDGDPIFYILNSGPAGLTMNSVNGVISWVPSANQLNFNQVNFSVSDGKTPTTVSFFIFVEAATAPAPAEPIIVEPSEARVVISDLSMRAEDGVVIVSWNTNIPTRARVIFGDTSEATKTRNFTYDDATPEILAMSRDHEVKLEDLEMEKVYYLRAVAKTDGQTVTSREVTFVQLPGQGGLQFFGAASLLSTLGNLLTEPIVLLLAIVGMLIFMYLQNKKIAKLKSPL
ncbi:MAG: EF hand domain/PKD domain-containing protein [Parcubacteria group bacterium Gr01-1014_3]|nr:MAG: EF hand domain/PKD domain-containing protein [Parcubacteria group bacterium Gr01-1014_3]